MEIRHFRMTARPQRLAATCSTCGRCMPFHPTAATNALTENRRVDIEGLAWSSDDKDILLGGPQLRRISFSHSEQLPSVIPYVPGPAKYPSLRGNFLAYSQDWVNANIWTLMLQDGIRPVKQPTRLIESTRQQAAASFSPDGTRIAFQSDRSGAWEIWRSGRDGSQSGTVDTLRWSAYGNAPMVAQRATHRLRFASEGRS